MKCPTEFTTVLQPTGSKLCGACVAAMAVGKTLDQVLREMDWRRLTRTCGVAEYLARHDVLMGVAPTWTGNADASAEEWSRDEYSLPIKVAGWPAVVGVKSLRYAGVAHWIFWDGAVFRDPSGVEQIERYEVTDIYPLTYFVEAEREWAENLPDRWQDSLFPPEAAADQRVLNVASDSLAGGRP